MGTRYVIDGDAKGAVKAVGDLERALAKAEKEAEGSTKTLKQLRTEAERIKEAVDPQEKYNRKLKELAEHVKAGRLSFDQAKGAAAGYRRELDGVGQSSEKAFGSGAVRQLASVAAGYLSIQAAIQLVTRALATQRDVEQAAADRTFRSRQGLGQLSQLAADPNPGVARANFTRLVAEARSYVTSGAAIDEGDAGSLLFDMASAGLGSGDRAIGARLRGSGALQNVGGAAYAFDALKTALGAGEVGSFREFLSKAIQAAKTAPGSFEGLPIALARAGGSAKELGISDEFLLSAGGILARQRNSPEQGATLLASFLRGAEKSGIKGLKGIGGVGLLEKFAALPEKQRTFGGELGERAEAVEALRTLLGNFGEVKTNESNIAAALRNDLAGVSAGLPDSDPQLRSARSRAAAVGSLAIGEQSLFAERQNLFETVRSRRLGATAGSGFVNLVERGVFAAQAFVGNQDTVLQDAISAPASQSGLTTQDVADIKDYLRRNTAASEGINRKVNKSATVRE